MDKRLETIETKLMAAEDQLDALNKSLWRQQQELDTLREHMRQLAQYIKDQSQSGSQTWRPEDEIPPHW